MRPLNDREWLEQIRVDMLGRSLADYDHATRLLGLLDDYEAAYEPVSDPIRADLLVLLADLGIDAPDDPISILRMFLPVD